MVLVVVVVVVEHARVQQMRRVSVAIVAMSTATDRVQLSHRCEMANESRAVSASGLRKLQMMLLLLGLPVGREVVTVLQAR